MNKPLIDEMDIWVMDRIKTDAGKDEDLPGSREVLIKRVSRGIRYVREMENYLLKIKQQIESGQLTGKLWSEGVTEIMVASERMNNLCRGMMIDEKRSVQVNRGEKLEELLLTQSDIRIGFTEQGWFYLRIPAILPHKKRGHSWYLEGILWAAFGRWQRERIAMGEPIKRFHEKCVIVYRTTYDRLMPGRRLTDFDNFEYKVVTDMITGPLLVDDGPQYLDAHYMANIAGEGDFTEVYLVPECDYPVCYRMLKENMPLNILYQFCS